MDPFTSPINDDAMWDRFKKILNSWGSLKWKIESPSYQVHFLDLNITLSRSKISTSTYQKEMNLYLYIPPKSAHPPSCFKDLIHGELQRYWNQNNPTDFQNITTNFIQRLVERGHTIEDITPLLLQAAFQLNPTTTIKSSQNNSEEDTLYIHWEHHPHGIQRRDLRQIYNKTLSKVSPFKKWLWLYPGLQT